MLGTDISTTLWLLSSEPRGRLARAWSRTPFQFDTNALIFSFARYGTCSIAMLQNHRGYPSRTETPAMHSVPLMLRPSHSTHHTCMLTTMHLSNRNCPKQASQQQMRGNRLLSSTPGTSQPADHVCRSCKQRPGNKVCRDLESPGPHLRFHD